MCVYTHMCIYIYIFSSRLLILKDDYMFQDSSKGGAVETGCSGLYAVTY